MAPTHEGLRSNQWPLGCGTVPHDRRFRFALSCSGTGIENGEQFTELARKAEALGYSTLFVPDHFVDHPLAPTVALTHAAAVTTTLRVGSFVLGNDYRHPVVRIARLSEAIAVLKGLFAPGPFTFDGEHYQVHDLDGAPEPVQQPIPFL